MYKRVLGPKLSEAVAQATGIDPDEQVAVYAELALMREYAGNFVAIYSATVEQPDVKPEQVLAAGAAMKDALVEVVGVADKAGKIQAKQRDRFSIHDLKFVIDKVLVLHNRVCMQQGLSGEELAKAFAKAIDEELVLPNQSVQPTALHQDQTAAMFDNVVPRVTDANDDDDDD